MPASFTKFQHFRASIYWRKTLSVTLCLSAVWLMVSLAPLVLAEMPSHWTVMGWPAGYAIVAFVAPLTYLLLIGLYAWRMECLDRRSQAAHSVSGKGAEVE